MDLVNNFKSALSLIKNLSHDDREVVKSKCIEIRNLQNEILQLVYEAGDLDIYKKHTAECCENKNGNKNIELDPTFFVSFLLLVDKEIRKKIFEIISSQKSSDDKCVFKNEDNCALPVNLKPISCIDQFRREAILDFDTSSYGIILTMINKDIEDLISVSNSHKIDVVTT